nr:MAG TPA: hypothetical protein [Caudoviricetes sp.]
MSSYIEIYSVKPREPYSKKGVPKGANGETPYRTTPC